MIHPREPKDLVLAPVAVEVDRNLQTMRGLEPRELDSLLQLELDAPCIDRTREERAGRVLRAATRNVDMHGWLGEINRDGSALRLTGGSATIDLALSPTVRRYIEAGPS